MNQIEMEDPEAKIWRIENENNTKHSGTGFGMKRINKLRLEESREPLFPLFLLHLMAKLQKSKDHRKVHKKQHEQEEEEEQGKNREGGEEEQRASMADGGRREMGDLGEMVFWGRETGSWVIGFGLQR